jgi:hypothetical protein
MGLPVLGGLRDKNKDPDNEDPYVDIGHEEPFMGPVGSEGGCQMPRH